jgi:RimJ/RimL family protein N-acetyltransferase
MRGRAKTGCGIEAAILGSSLVDIREIDPHDEATLHRWWELAYAVDHVDRPWSWFMAWETTKAMFQTPNGAWDRILLGAFEDGVIVAGANIQAPVYDNTHVAHVWPFVPVDHRRRGIGSALVERAMAIATARGRTSLMTEVFVPRGADAPGLPFAKRHGFEVGITDGSKLADLAATEPTWQALAEEAATHHDGYRLVTFHDVVPDELVAGYCTLNGSFNAEAPVGDLDIEPEVFDEARVREKERVFRATSRHEVGTIAVGPDGTVAGFTEVMVSRHAPERAMQGGTLVSRAHRGHRLGLAMKVANMRALRERFPGCERIITCNADVNAHMNAVNERLGFHEVEQCVAMQRRV